MEFSALIRSSNKDKITSVALTATGAAGEIYVSATKIGDDPVDCFSTTDKWPFIRHDSLKSIAEYDIGKFTSILEAVKSVNLLNSMVENIDAKTVLKTLNDAFVEAKFEYTEKFGADEPAKTRKYRSRKSTIGNKSSVKGEVSNEVSELDGVIKMMLAEFPYDENSGSNLSEKEELDSLELEFINSQENPKWGMF